MQRILEGLGEPEGPVALADGGVVFVEMASDRACVARTGAGGERIELCRPGGRPNGLAVDGDGDFWIAGGPADAVGRMSPQGEILGAIRDGFRWPNDLAFGPDGRLYLTDSGVRPEDMVQHGRLRADWLELDYRGEVVEIEPRDGRVLRRLARGLKFANGIAFGPDGALYYHESHTGLVYRQPLDGEPAVYANVLDRPPTDRFRGPDGMAFAEDGTLYCAIFGAGCLAVVAPGGEVVERLRIDGPAPTNVAFAEDDSGDLFVTEAREGRLLRLHVGRRGLPLHKPKLGLARR
jgi:gluconolactonase